MPASRERQEAKAPHGDARFAGFLYAIVVVTGLFSLGYAPERIFAGQTDTEIVRSVVAHEGLLRLSIAAELACYTAFLVLPLALYGLLAPAGRFAAMLMVALAVASVPLGFANIMHLLEILRGVDGGGAETAPSSVMLALDRYRSGLFVLSIPWGLWLIPFGYLVIRCGFLPRVLGVLLILAGLGYVAHFLGRLLFEGYEFSGLAPLFKAPRISEILVCLWLLAFGARGIPRLRRRRS